MRVLDRLPLRGLVHNLPARAKATLAVVAILGLAASAYVYATTASNLQREQEELFRDHASARIQSVEDSLQSNVALASSLNALFHSSQEVTYSEFRTFAAEAQAGLEHPHLAAWAPRIPGEDRLTTEQSLRKEQYPGFQFQEIGAEGRLVPAEPRDEYYPFTYITPSSTETNALAGLDLAAEPRLREAIADLGPLEKTVARVKLPDETGELQPTLLLLQSVNRRKGTNPVTGEINYGEITGFVVTEICVECAVSVPGIHETGEDTEKLFITIRDGDPAKGADVLAQNLSLPPTAEDTLPSLVSPITLADQKLYIQATATDPLGRGSNNHLPLALAGGILAAVTLTLLYILFLYRRALEQASLIKRLGAARRDLELEIKERERMGDHLRHVQRAESIGRLSGGIAHDFNNLLTTILGNTSALLAADHLEEEDRAMVEEIDSAASIATEVTNQLLAFARGQILKPKLVKINQEVIDMKDILQHFLGPEIELNLEMGEDVGCVLVDHAQLQQVVINLVVNSCDSMPKEKGHVSISTQSVLVSDWDNVKEEPSLVGVEQMNEFLPGASVPQGRYVRLTVADDGAGMSTPVLEKAFEPFFTTKERSRGTGLGLAATHGIVTQSHGGLRAYTAPAKGTVMAIYLPATKPEEEAPPAESLVTSTVADGTAPTSQRSVVMVVDDEDSLRGMATRVLQGHGWEILSARNGDEAMQLSLQLDGTLNLLVTDVLMPGMNGPTLASNLSELHPNMEVLYMSGYTEDVFAQTAVQAQELDLLEKPFRPAELVKRVEAALARRRTTRD